MDIRNIIDSVHPRILMAGVLACMPLCLAQPAFAAEPEKAPANGTHLGVLVVTPTRPAVPDPKKHKADVKRSSLKLEMNIGFDIKKIKHKPAAVRQQPNSTPSSRASQSAPPAAQPAAPRPVRRTPASALHIVSPEYPPDAYRAGTEGSVTVRFTIDEDGDTDDIEILSSEPPEVFDEATVDAVEEWEFNPATVNGEPVATSVTQTLVFNPPDRKQPAKQTPQQQPAQQVVQKPPSSPAGSFPANRVPANIHPVNIVPPQYPSKAYRAQVGGSVTVKFTVGTDGQVEDIEILKADPPRIFENAIRKAIWQWVFQPVDKPTVVIQTIHFTPPDD